MSVEESLEANMYQAYLAHRLLEELNDVLSVNYNCPVIPVNMTGQTLLSTILSVNPLPIRSTVLSSCQRQTAGLAGQG